MIKDLLLQDGSFFSGKSLGQTGETVGEVCFNTGMTGYQEILTVPHTQTNSDHDLSSRW